MRRQSGCASQLAGPALEAAKTIPESFNPLGESMGRGSRRPDRVSTTAWVLPRRSHQVAERMMKMIMSSGICRFLVAVSRAQTALGAPSLVFSPSARTCFLNRSPCYAFGREHALKAKILRDHRAPF